jgi:hypothetical protein
MTYLCYTPLLGILGIFYFDKEDVQVISLAINGLEVI